MDYVITVRKWFAVSVILLLTIYISALSSDAATEIESGSSLNPVGSGARAAGMGGAFIAVADDATAASWNPAGLIQLEKPEVSAVYSYFDRSQEYKNDGLTSLGDENEMDAQGLNYASAAFPFVLLDRNMIFSINYQRLYEMNKEIDYGFGLLFMTNETARSTNEFKQKGHLYTISPAFAVQVLPELYLGVTLNIWDDIVGSNGWVREESQHVVGTLFTMPFEQIAVTRDEVDFSGRNAHAGFLWNITDSLTLGGVYKSSFEADLKKKTTEYGSQLVFGSSSVSPPETTFKDLKMKMPASCGLGLAYRHSDEWTVALDVYVTDWSKFVLVDEDGTETNPATGFALSEGKLKDTTQVRLGTEYLFIEGKNVIPARFGLFYDPEPQTGHIDEYYGFSLGTGFARGRVVMDMSYQYRMGKDLTGDLFFIEGTTVDIKQHTVMASVIVYLE